MFLTDSGSRTAVEPPPVETRPVMITLAKETALPDLTPHCPNGGDVRHEGDQCDVPGSLDRQPQGSLVFGADSGTAARFYLRPVGNKPANAVHVLVVDGFHVVNAE